MPEEEKIYCSMYSRNAELYHHGIKGQKWGVQNGPPYPLGSDVSTGSRLKKTDSRAGGIKKADNSNKKENKKNNKIKDFIEKKKKEWNNLSQEEKENIGKKASIIFGASVTIGTLVYSVLESTGLDEAIKVLHDIGEEQKDNIKNNEEFLNFKTKQDDISDIEKINPYYITDEKWMSNCALCSVTYDMRKRGYDVTANPSKHGRTINMIANMYNKPFSKESPDVQKTQSIDDFKQNLESMPDGSRGVMGVNSGEFGSRHAMAWEKRNGEVFVIDGQDSIEHNLNDAIETKRINADRTRTYEIVRLDDTFPNSKVKDACRNYQDDYGINENDKDIFLLPTDEAIEEIKKIRNKKNKVTTVQLK